MRKLFLLMLIFLSFSFNTWAEDTPKAPPKTKKTPDLETVDKVQFGDWSYQCKQKGKVKRCVLVQNPKLKNGQQILTLIITKAPETGKIWLIAHTPLGVYLPTGLVFSIDGGVKQSIPFRICTPQGCEANVVMSKGLVQDIKTGIQMKVGFKDGRKYQEIVIDVSLLGLTNAIAKLNK